MIDQDALKEVNATELTDVVAGMYAVTVGMKWLEEHPAYIEALMPFLEVVDNAADEYLDTINR